MKKTIDVHDLKKGRFMLIDDKPCVVTKIERSAPGKHGHAKFRITGVGVLDDKKRVIIKPGGAKIDVPIIDKRNAQVLNLMQKVFDNEGNEKGTKAQIMDLESYETTEITIPKEEVGKVVSGSVILYWVVMGEKLFKGIK